MGLSGLSVLPIWERDMEWGYVEMICVLGIWNLGYAGWVILWNNLVFKSLFYVFKNWGWGF